MGASLSCCCGGRRKLQGEKEPLLPRHRDEQPSQTTDRPRHAQTQKFAQALAALSAGKVPSQPQLDDAVQSLQTSVLDTRDSLNPGSSNYAYGPLSARGREILDDITEACQAVLQFGVEKNYDDAVQEFWYHSSRVDDPVHVQPNTKLKQRAKEAQTTFANEIPVTSTEEVNSDISDTLTALRTLASLVLTSSAFRLILSDILITSREIVADVAANVSNVAELVREEAVEVDEMVRPPTAEDAQSPDEVLDTVDTEAVKNKGKDIIGLAEEIPTKLAQGVEEGNELVPESTERIREAIVERVRAIILQAQSDPAYEAALVIIFDVLHKYVERASQLSAAAGKAANKAKSDTDSPNGVSPTDLAPVELQVDDKVMAAVGAARRLLNRFGDGVEGVINQWEALIHHTYSNPGELKDYLGDVSAWLRKAMNTPQWIHQDAASTELAQLYDRGRALLELDPELKSIITELSNESARFVDALQNDQATQRLLAVLPRLGRHAADLGFTSAKVMFGRSEELIREARQELWADAIGWLLPRVLRALKAIPFPRVEYASEALDAVIDDLLLEAPSFVPDHVWVENSNSMRMIASDALAARRGGRTSQGLLTSKMEVASNLRIKVDGLRLSARLISYFVHAKLYGGWLGWKDRGLLSFDIGTQAGVDPSFEDPSSSSLPAPSSSTTALSEGITLDIDIQTAPPSAPSLFTVDLVRVDIPGLQFGITKSRHWLVNAILTPFLGPIVRRVVRGIVEAQLRALLEEGSKVMWRVKERAADITKVLDEAESQKANGSTRPSSHTTHPSLATYVTAFLEIREEDAQEAEAEAEAEASPTENIVETQFTTRGVVRRTLVEDLTSGDIEGESALAIGVGPQLLLDEGEAGPDTTEEGRGVDVVAREAKDAVEDVQEAAEDTAERAAEVSGEVANAAQQTKEEVREGAEMFERRKKKERRRDGWRSDAFDL
ncbi:hypothetical protein DL93DRAFT_1849617 [Clavulina sp. PMI_390]|nr:hypothetical protein DL93DRAFT_1849617 [Clavulina sp. PMI_390]